MALDTGSGLGANRAERRRDRDRCRVSPLARSRKRSGAGPAGDALGPGPLPVPAERGTSLALVDHLTIERWPLRLELGCEIAALHGKRRSERPRSPLSGRPPWRPRSTRRTRRRGASGGPRRRLARRATEIRRSGERAALLLSQN